MAWRNAGKSDEEKNTEERERKKSVRFAGESDPKTNSTVAVKTSFSFLAGLGGNEFNLDMMPTWTEGGTNTLA